MIHPNDPTAVIVARLRRKADIILLDAKAKHDRSLTGDVEEILALIDLLQREHSR